jgi:Protein of unknown function (DUF3892)
MAPKMFFVELVQLGHIVSVVITNVRFSGTSKTHESIVRYKWKSEQDNSIGESDKPSLVKWVDVTTNHAYVKNGSSKVSVGSVHPTSTPAYVRTHADGKWSDNLLALPTF